MTKTTFAVLATLAGLCVASGASAATWWRLGPLPNSGVLYADAELVRHNGDDVALKTMAVYPRAGDSDPAFAYLEVELNCHEKYQPLVRKRSSYDAHGRLLSSQEMDKLTNEEMDLIPSFACFDDLRYTLGARPVTDPLEDAFAFIDQ